MCGSRCLTVSTSRQVPFTLGKYPVTTSTAVQRGPVSPRRTHTGSSVPSRATRPRALKPPLCCTAWQQHVLSCLVPQTRAQALLADSLSPARHECRCGLLDFLRLSFAGTRWTSAPPAPQWPSLDPSLLPFSLTPWRPISGVRGRLSCIDRHMLLAGRGWRGAHSQLYHGIMRCCRSNGVADAVCPSSDLPSTRCMTAVPQRPGALYHREKRTPPLPSSARPCPRACYTVQATGW